MTLNATGYRSVACSIDTKIISKGVCNHPCKRDINRAYLKDGLPIPVFEWTHCSFCRGDKCFFDGECVHRKEEEVENNV